MARTPLIGITGSYNEGEQSLDRRYVTAVERSGGTPVLLPTTDATQTIHRLSAHIDGLIVPGGPAVTESLVGTLPDDLDEPDPLRWTSDVAWYETCRDANVPVLGICYGMQLMNARAGGTIFGDVEVEHETATVHSQERGATDHEVEFVESTHMRNIFGRDTLMVNSRHLQAVERVGDGFRVAARAADGVIEAIEHENFPVLGVQFHPERMGTMGRPLVQALVDQAA